MVSMGIINVNYFLFFQDRTLVTILPVPGYCVAYAFENLSVLSILNVLKDLFRARQISS